MFVLIEEDLFITSAKEVVFVVLLFVSNFAQNLQMDLHELFREGWR